MKQIKPLHNFFPGLRFPIVNSCAVGKIIVCFAIKPNLSNGNSVLSYSNSVHLSICNSCRCFVLCNKLNVSKMRQWNVYKHRNCSEHSVEFHRLVCTTHKKQRSDNRYIPTCTAFIFQNIEQLQFT